MPPTPLLPPYQRRVLRPRETSVTFLSLQEVSCETVGVPCPSRLQ